MSNSAAVSILVKFMLLSVSARTIRSETTEAGYSDPENIHTARLYIGSYMCSHPYDEGITMLEMNKKGVFQKRGEVRTRNPSVLVADTSGRFIYATNDLYGNTQGEKGKITAYSIEKDKLTIVNWLDADGSSPAYVTLDPTGRFVLSANYGSGKVVVMALNEWGALDGITHVTKAPAGEPQDAKAHMVVFHPTRQNVVVVSYLGLDRIYFYKFDAKHGTLSPLDFHGGNNDGDRHLFAQLAKGVGPRHFVFNDNARFLYVIGEPSSTVTVFESLHDPITSADGFKQVQKLSTLPPGYKNKSEGAEIALHPNGNFIFASNRGNDSIAVFAVDGASGLLSPPCFYPTGGRTPRHFTLLPDGNRLIVGNEDSDSVMIFSVDASDGSLSDGRLISDSIRKPAFILYQERN